MLNFRSLGWKCVLCQQMESFLLVDGFGHIVWVFFGGWGMSLRKQCIFLSKDVDSLVISFSTTILSSKFIRRPWSGWSRLKAKASEVELLVPTDSPPPPQRHTKGAGFWCHCINFYHSHRPWRFLAGKKWSRSEISCECSFKSRALSLCTQPSAKCWLCWVWVFRGYKNIFRKILHGFLESEWCPKSEWCPDFHQ